MTVCRNGSDKISEENDVRLNEQEQVKGTLKPVSMYSMVQYGTSALNQPHNVQNSK